MADRFSVSDDAHAAAAQWYARMTSDERTPADRREFDQWIGASAAHSQAYLEVSSIADRAGALAADPAIAAFRAGAHGMAKRGQSARIFSWPAMGGASAVAAIAAAVAFAFVGTAQMDWSRWTTAPGQRSDIVLMDGTSVTAGPNTQFAFATDTSRRLLDLDHGHVFLDVTHDGARPFVVTAGEHTITVRGTAFDVLVVDKDMTLTLLRGRIDIALKGGSDQSAIALSPGQQFKLERGVGSVRQVDAEAATSWRKGLLDFDDISLAEAVAAFNGNSSRELRIGDPALRDLRVSGVFKADDVDAFAAALAVLYPIRVSAQASGDILLLPAN